MSGPTRSPARALSLAETVIAVFLLLCACLVVIALFHSSLRYSSRILVQSAAARVAEKHLTRVRSWARQKVSDKFNFEVPARWTATYPGSSAVDPDEPTFSVTVRQAQHTLASPCTALENPFAGQARQFTRSFRLVTVTVTWDPPLPSNRLSLTSLIGSPPRPVPTSVAGLNNLLVITARSTVSPLPFDATLTFDAQLQDTTGEPIPDVCFAWHVIPGVGGTATASGNGIIDPNDPDSLRSGRSATFRNNYPHYSHPWEASVPGQVAVGCVARYRGLQSEQRSSTWVNE